MIVSSPKSKGSGKPHESSKQKQKIDEYLNKKDIWLGKGYFQGNTPVALIINLTINDLPIIFALDFSMD